MEICKGYKQLYKTAVIVMKNTIIQLGVPIWQAILIVWLVRSIAWLTVQSMKATGCVTLRACVHYFAKSSYCDWFVQTGDANTPPV